MAQIERKELSPVEWELHLSIEPEDYLETYQEELRKLKGKVHLKGFRKGRVPLSFLMKTYGGQILPDIIDKAVEEQLEALEEETGRKFIHPPLPLKDEQVELNPKDAAAVYNFDFIVSLLPELDLNEEVFNGFDKPHYIPIPDQEEVEGIWEYFLDQVAAQKTDELPQRESLNEKEDLFAYFTVKAIRKIARNSEEENEGEEKREKGQTLTEEPADFSLVLNLKQLTTEDNSVREALKDLKKGQEVVFCIDDIDGLIHEIDGKNPKGTAIVDWEFYDVQEYVAVFEFTRYIDEEQLELTQEDFDAFFNRGKVCDKEEALLSIRDYLKSTRLVDSKQLLMWQFMLYLNELWSDKLIYPAIYMARKKEIGRYKFNPGEKMEKWMVLDRLLQEYFKPEVSRQMVEDVFISSMGLENTPDTMKQQFLELVSEKPEVYRREMSKAYEMALTLVMLDFLNEKIKTGEKEIPEAEFDELMVQVKSSLQETFEIFESRKDEEE